MLDAFIIEQIRRREEENRRDDRPFLELPLPQPEHSKPQEEEKEAKRVIIIDTMDDELDDFTIDL